MIGKKTNPALLLLLLCQLLLIALLYLPDTDDKQAVTALLPGITADTVNGLTVTDANGKKLSLQKDDSGDWMVDDGNADEFPADNGQVQRLIRNLTSLQSQRLVTKTRSSHIRLQVDDEVFTKQIYCTTKDGQKATLFLGSSPAPQTIHVRVQNMDNVYLAGGISAWELDTNKETWLRKGYVLLDKNRLQTVTLQNGHGSFALTREGEKWHVNGDDPQQEPEPVTLNGFLQQVTHIAVNAYLGKKYEGPSLGTAALTLVTDKETITVNIGPREDEKNREHVIKSSASPFFAIAGSYQIDPLIGMKKEDLYKKMDGKENK